MEQRALPGFDASPTRRDRVFFAAMLEPSVAAQVAERARTWWARTKSSGTLIEAHRLHVSLVGVGANVDDSTIERAKQAAAGVEMPPFTASFDRLASFRGPLVLLGDEGVVGFTWLRRRLLDALDASPAEKARAHEPHVTLLYDDVRTSEQRIAPATWRVSDFVLLRSIDGQPHIELGRWALR